MCHVSGITTQGYTVFYQHWAARALDTRHRFEGEIRAARRLTQLTYTQQRACSIRTPHWRGFPSAMPLRDRKRYVSLWREIRFNTAHHINTTHTEHLRDLTHQIIARFQ